jgi:hypothetical protein
MSGFKVNFSVNNQLATPSIHAAPFAQRPAAGQPGRVFIDTDSPSTGIYRDTGTTWIQIAGTGGGGGDLQTVTDAGNTTTNDISIGTSSPPSAPLDVHGAGVIAILQGTGTNDSFLQFNKSGNGKFKIGNVHNSGNDYFSVYNLQENSDAILVNISTNNVAIGGGTVSPSYRLEVTGSLRNTGNAFFATSGGTVGIGTTTVSNGIFQVTTTSTGDVVYFNRGSNYIKFGGLASGTGSYIAAFEGEFQVRNNFNGAVSFWNNNTEKARIAITTGNFLVNTTTDAGFKLDINGTARIQGNTTFLTGSLTSSIGEISAAPGNSAFWMQTSSPTLSNYAIRKNASGRTWVNCDTGQNLNLAVADTPVVTISTTAGNLLDFASGQSTIRFSNQLWEVQSFNRSGGSNLDFHITNNQGGINYSLFIDGNTNNVGLSTSTPNASALLDMTSTTKGFLPPRMTGAQAEAIATPAAGLMVYANNGNGTTITTTGWWGYDGAAWVKLN